MKKILKELLKREVDSENLFSRTSPYMPEVLKKRENVGDIVLTYAIRRLIILTAQAWRFGEPVLLVGETGCGKTTVAQIVAEVS